MPNRACRALAVAALVAACQGGAAFAQREAKVVLTINWGEEDFPGTAALNAAIRRTVTANFTEPIHYYSEYFESETFPNQDTTLAFRDYLKRKFADRRIDVVIAVTTPALDFALLYREELFPGVPIVFVAGVAPRDIQPHPGVTGVISDTAFADTVELALQLHPSTTQVFVVAHAPTVPEYVDRIRTVLKPFESRARFVYNTAYTMPALLDNVRKLPADSLIFFTRFLPEDAKTIVYSDYIARRMYEVSPVPIYSSADLFLGTGVVGGMMRSSELTGTRLAEIARRILDGARPEETPIAPVPSAPTFDWRQVQRWGIRPDALPPGSAIHFRVPSVWETYRTYIVGTVVLVIAQAALIAALLTNRARRKKAEDTILAREASLRASYDRIRTMAGRLINAQEAARAGIARDLHDDVCQKLAYVSIGVNSLRTAKGDIQDPETQKVFEEFERDTRNTFDGIRRLSHDLHPATLRLLGLAPALRSHCSEIAKRHNVAVKFTSGDIGTVHPDVAVCFFRIAQESLRNGIDHGGATHLDVALARSGDRLEMTVADDGTGFDVGAVHHNGADGLGLVTMEERINLVGGRTSIVSELGRGTTVRVEGPAEPALQTGN